jgi:hypothetical protein
LHRAVVDVNIAPAVTIGPVPLDTPTIRENAFGANWQRKPAIPGKVLGVCGRPECLSNRSSRVCRMKVRERGLNAMGEKAEPAS